MRSRSAVISMESTVNRTIPSYNGYQPYTKQDAGDAGSLDDQSPFVHERIPHDGRYRMH
jgi:hypothetical protein